ncbi:MAG: protein kinase [Deltaproteobacteria bacterium]|nr:protein kinase [Deltaproteobacteria bacterium]
MAADPLIGRTLLSQFEVQDVCGTGAMGTVYRAWQNTMERLVAIKVLHKELTRDPDVVRRFHREARAVARLSHPSIVTVYLVGQTDDGLPYMVMEYVDGVTLEQVCEADAPLDALRAVRIARQIAEGLASAHEAGVIHRDLKPANVLIVPRKGKDDDAIKILDFGIAKVLGTGLESKITRTGTVFGTPHYIAPEQASGQDTDHRADLYALGIVLYRMCTAQVPFDASRGIQVLLAHMNQVATAPRLLNPVLPEAVEDIILRAMEKDRDRRYQSAGEMAAALAAIERELRSPSPSQQTQVGILGQPVAPVRRSATPAPAAPPASQQPAVIVAGLRHDTPAPRPSAPQARVPTPRPAVAPLPSTAAGVARLGAANTQPTLPSGGDPAMTSHGAWFADSDAWQAMQDADAEAAAAIDDEPGARRRLASQAVRAAQKAAPEPAFTAAPAPRLAQRSSASDSQVAAEASRIAPGGDDDDSDDFDFERPRRRRGGVILGVGALLLAGAAIGAIFVARMGGDSSSHAQSPSASASPSPSASASASPSTSASASASPSPTSAGSPSPVASASPSPSPVTPAVAPLVFTIGEDGFSLKVTVPGRITVPGALDASFDIRTRRGNPRKEGTVTTHLDRKGAPGTPVAATAAGDPVGRDVAHWTVAKAGAHHAAITVETPWRSVDLWVDLAIAADGTVSLAQSGAGAPTASVAPSPSPSSKPGKTKPGEIPVLIKPSPKPSPSPVIDLPKPIDPMPLPSPVPADPPPGTDPPPPVDPVPPSPTPTPTPEVSPTPTPSPTPEPPPPQDPYGLPELVNDVPTTG